MNAAERLEAETAARERERQQRRDELSATAAAHRRANPWWHADQLVLGPDLNSY
jgi:hypothetical protein